MVALTLRLETNLAKELDQLCREKGYSKNGLIKTLIRNFLKGEGTPKSKRSSPVRKLKKLVGIVSLGGDSVADAEKYFE